MKSQFIRSGDRGAVLHLAVVLVFLALIVVGLAVDGANLYRNKLRMQRAIDAAATRGTFLMPSIADNDKITAAALNIARDNLVQSGLFDADRFAAGLQVRARVDVAGSRQLTVSGDAPVPILLLQSTPWFSGDNNLVAATAVGEHAASAISIVIDATGSMLCPAVGSCLLPDGSGRDCNNAVSQPPECAALGPTKLDVMKEAAKDFIDMLNGSLDQVSLVTFNDGVEVKKPMGPFARSALHTMIDEITTRDGTDIALGIASGSQQLASAPGSSRRAMVLLTDGAPNRSSGTTSCGSIGDAERPYVRAIEEADLVRTTYGATLYTIGLGQPAYPSSTDAYQDTTDVDSVKSNLLRRLANAQESKDDPAFDCVPDARTHDAEGGTSNGMSLESPDGADLSNLFRRIGDSFRARLIQ